MDKIRSIYYTPAHLFKPISCIMLIVISTNQQNFQKKLIATLKKPNSPSDNCLFIRIEHAEEDITAANEAYLLSTPFMALLKKYLPKRINRIAISNADFSQWMNERVNWKYRINFSKWLEDRADKPLFHNQLLCFFNQLSEQFTQIDLSLSTLGTLGSRVSTTGEFEVRFNNQKALLKILQEKPLVFLGLNHSDFYQYGKDVHQFLMSHLSPSMNRLRLDNLVLESEANNPRETFPVLNFPENIKTLDVSGEHADTIRVINDDNITYFVRLLNSVSTNINTLNISGREMTQWSETIQGVEPNETAHHFINQLWAAIPENITKVIIKNADLAKLSIKHLERFFSHFPERIALELSDNGFNQLPFSELNRKLAVLPNTVLEFESEHLYLRQDRRVIWDPSIHLSAPYLTPFHQVLHQKDPITLHKNLLEPMQEKGFRKKEISTLLTYIEKGSEWTLVNNQDALLKKLYSPLIINQNSEIEQEITYTNAFYRIHLFIENNKSKGAYLSTKLNLSYAQLASLSQARLEKLFLNIPHYVTHLTMTGNAFARESKSLMILAKAMKKITHWKRNIYIDLSDNEFYKLAYSPIFNFLRALPQQIMLSLSTDKPTTPYNHRCRIQWLNKYALEAAKHDNLLDFASTLLKGYTKNGRYWLLVLTLHWNRNHFHSIKSETDRLDQIQSDPEKLLNPNTIENSDDLLAKLNRYRESNSKGDLARRLAALSIFSEMKEVGTAETSIEAVEDESNFQMVVY